MVFSLVYRSRTTHDWGQDHLLGLLEGSRRRNADHAITGILLYRSRLFMQLIEGEEAAVTRLFANIRSDRRHDDVDLLWTDVAAQREFVAWSMAFREIPEHPVERPGYDTLLNPAGRTRSARPSVITDFLAEVRSD